MEKELAVMGGVVRSKIRRWMSARMVSPLAASAIAAAMRVWSEL